LIFSRSFEPCLTVLAYRQYYVMYRIDPSRTVIKLVVTPLDRLWTDEGGDTQYIQTSSKTWGQLEREVRSLCKKTLAGGVERFMIQVEVSNTNELGQKTMLMWPTDYLLYEKCLKQ
jgi:hypothetical protein